MKKIILLFLCTILLGNLFVFAQNQNQTERLLHKKELIYLEGGINMSLPVHIQMYRSHRLAIGINLRAAKPISSKTELGVRFEFDYRFIKENSRNLTPESTLEERALHSNFSLITIKSNFQFNWNSHWFLGAETGIGYAISDEDPKIGLGFISEYDSSEQFGSCSGLYIGRYFTVKNQKKKLGISLSFTNFVANWHAENSLGLKFNYRLKN
jgi:hypothetical protein